MARSASDFLQRLADALEKLRVAIQREEHALEDLADVVQPCLEQRLRLDSLDLQLHLAEVGVRADADVEQLPDLGENSHPGIEVITSISILSTLTTGMSARTSGPCSRS